MTTVVPEAWAEGDRQQMRPLTNSSGHEGYSEEISKPPPPGEHHGRAWPWQAPVLSNTQLPLRESDEIKGMENISDFSVSSEDCSIALTFYDPSHEE